MSDPTKTKFRCGACGEIVPYGKHCSKMKSDPHNTQIWDKAHADFIAKNGHLYEEIKE